MLVIMHVYTVGDGLSEGEINILHAIVTKKRLVIGGGIMLLAKLRMELFKKNQGNTILLYPLHILYFYNVVDT